MGSAPSFPTDGEWPIGDMPAMPFKDGMNMLRVAFREQMFLRHKEANVDLLLQHKLAVREADNKWQIQKSVLKTEAANRFWLWARGVAVLVSAFGGGSVVTLLVEHLLLA